MFRSCTLALLLAISIVTGCSDAPDVIPPKPGGSGAGAGAGTGGKSGSGGASAGKGGSGKGGSGEAGHGEDELDAGSEQDASL